MSLIIAIAALAGLPLLAIRGVGYRGLYIAGALIFGALAWIARELVNAPSPATMTAAEAAGAAFINDNGFAFGIVCGVTAFACLVGAAVFRSRPALPKG